MTNFVTETVPIAPMPPIKHLLLTERYVAPGAKLQMSKYNTNTITNTLTKEPVMNKIRQTSFKFGIGAGHKCKWTPTQNDNWLIR